MCPVDAEILAGIRQRYNLGDPAAFERKYLGDGVGAKYEADALEGRRPLLRLKRLGVGEVYTRLNVSGGARETEHRDVVARYDPQFIGDDAP